jgi:hypothetical protein
VELVVCPRAKRDRRVRRASTGGQTRIRDCGQVVQIGAGLGRANPRRKATGLDGRLWFLRMHVDGLPAAGARRRGVSRARMNSSASATGRAAQQARNPLNRRTGERSQADRKAPGACGRAKRDPKEQHQEADGAATAIFLCWPTAVHASTIRASSSCISPGAGNLKARARHWLRAAVERSNVCVIPAAARKTCERRFQTVDLTCPRPIPRGLPQWGHVWRVKDGGDLWLRTRA